MTDQKKSSSHLQKRTETKKVTAKEKETASPKSSGVTKRSVSQFSKPKLAVVLALFAIIIAVIAVFEGASSWSKLNELSASHKVTLQQLQQLQQNSQQLQQKFNAVTQQLQQSQKQIKENAATIQRLQTDNSANSKTWVLMGISHLLRLAQLNIAFSYDIPTTLALLNTTQQRLAKLADPITLQLRQAIADNITKLKAIPKLDLVGVLVKLNALELQVATLPLASDKRVQTNIIAKKNDAETATETGWRNYWNQSLATIEKLVIIRRQNQPIMPLISPKQQISLINNIQTKLATASWALIHRNGAVYQLSLQQTQRWINQYYAQDAQATKSVINNLQQLQKIEIKPKLPNLSSTINLADELIKKQ